MAATKEKVVARGADVPLALQKNAVARDALTDPREGDYVPDVDTKGLHVGEVRQPAEPVLKASGAVGFESLPDAGGSKFAESTYAEQKAAADAWEQDQGDAYAGREHVAIETDPAKVAELKAAQASAPKASRSSRGSRGYSAADKLDDESADVAESQAAEDSKG